MSAPSSSRTGPDRCPGLLRPHLAADGAVVRLRLPGGMITAAALTEVADAAERFADGQVQVTSRANLQLRGVPVGPTGDVPEVLVDRIRSAGLLPSQPAELIRNVLCSPLTGRLGGLADLRPVVEQLDGLLCGSAELTGLSGRFLFALDDGRGDIASAGGDIGIIATSADEAVLVAGGDLGPVVQLGTAAHWLARMAVAFLRLRDAEAPGCWHVAELPGGGSALFAALAAETRNDPAPHRELPRTDTGKTTDPDDRGTSSLRGPGVSRLPPSAQPFYGLAGQRDRRSLLSLVVPLGRLSAVQARAAAAAAHFGSGRLVVTPWHGLVVCDLAADIDSPVLLDLAAALAAAGLPSSSDSGWIGVSACTGSPGCARAAGPTGPVAARIATRTAPGAEPVHVVACERRCGAPATAHREVMVELGGQRSRHQPPLAARVDDGRTARRRTAGPAGSPTLIASGRAS